MKKYNSSFLIIFLSSILLCLLSCGESGTSNNNNKIDTTKNKDTIRFTALQGFSFADMAVHSTQDSCDIFAAIMTVNHSMTIVLMAPNSKINYFETEPDAGKITPGDVDSWIDRAPNPYEMKFADVGYYYILKAKSGKFYQIYTLDIKNSSMPMPTWTFVLLWKEVQIGI